jgi:hypothetical protein
MTEIPATYDASLTARRGDLRNLAACAREFVRHRSPQALGVGVTAVAVARALAGRWSWRDALVPPTILVLQPFVEWVIHKYLLHLPPFQIRGRTVELPSSAEHRRHHLAPSDLDRVLLTAPEAFVFLAQITAVSALVVLAAGALLGGPFLALWLTATGCSYLGLLRYEWSHFLIHTPYVPKSRWYRAIWRNHRLHHFKHEEYWLGVSTNFGDRILGTNPEPRAVERSPTARTLIRSPQS